MGTVSTMMIKVLVVLCLFGEAFSKTKKHHDEEISTEFDFFYFVQQVKEFSSPISILHYLIYFLLLK